MQNALKKKNYFYKIFRFLPAGFYSALIWILSSRTFVFSLHGIDKTLHTVEYGILGFFIAYGTCLNKENFKTTALQTLILGLTIGLIDEIHQYFVPGRSCDALDLFADGIGVSLGIFVFFFVQRFLSRFYKPAKEPVNKQIYPKH